MSGWRCWWLFPRHSGEWKLSPCSLWVAEASLWSRWLFCIIIKGYVHSLFVIWSKVTFSIRIVTSLKCCKVLTSVTVGMYFLSLLCCDDVSWLNAWTSFNGESCFPAAHPLYTHFFPSQVMQPSQSSMDLWSGQDSSRSTIWMDCFCFDVIKKHPQRKYFGLGVFSSRVERNSLQFFFHSVLQLCWSLSTLVHVISH